MVVKTLLQDRRPERRIDAISVPNRRAHTPDYKLLSN
jgi:hypothetical protein